MRQNEGAMALGNKDATRLRPLVVVTDDRFGDNAALERTILEREGCDLRVAACKTAADVIEAGRDADALLVNMAPLNAEAIAGLERCRVLSRYGVGLDNVDLKAAAIIAVTSILGAWLGAFLANKLSGPVLRLAFGIFVVFAGFYLIYGAVKRLGWL